MHFIHTADLHMCAAPDADMPWAKERALANKSSLPRIISLAKMENADLLLISGDLYHRVPIHKELKEANYYFTQIPDTKVVIIAGNHDRITDYSPYRDFEWAPNVSFIATPFISSVYFEDLNVEVHGFSYTAQENTEPLLDGIKAPQDGRLHILMAHGGDETHVPLKLAQLARSGFDYIALGHIHKPRIFKGTRMAYCGSPEPLNCNDIGPRGIITGDLTADTFDLKWRRLAQMQYREFLPEITPELIEPELIDAISAELSAHPEDIYKIVLRGSRAPEISFDTEAIKQLGRVTKVVDETSPAYNVEKLLREHNGDLIAHFINEMLASSDPLSENALYYGLNALLNSND